MRALRHEARQRPAYACRVAKTVLRSSGMSGISGKGTLARWAGLPGCGVINHASRITTLPGRFTCLDCGKRFSVTAGTPMHSTHLPIRTWMIAMYLIASSSKGISSLKLASLLGLQYRTTWHLTHRIRAMMDSDPALLKGIVETHRGVCMGGKPRGSNKPQAEAAQIAAVRAARAGKAGQG